MKNKYKENPPLDLSFPLKLQQLEEGKNVPGDRRNHSGVAGGSSKISTKQVLLPGQGGTESSLLEPGVGIRASPGKTPRLLVPLEFSTGDLDRKRKSRFPRKRNKILDSSDHLLSPNSSSNIHPSPSLAGCRSSTRLPWPGTRAGRGRGQGRAEGVAFRL